MQVNTQMAIAKELEDLKLSKQKIAGMKKGNRLMLYKQVRNLEESLHQTAHQLRNLQLMSQFL